MFPPLLARGVRGDIRKRRHPTLPSLINKGGSKKNVSPLACKGGEGR